MERRGSWAEEEVSIGEVIWILPYVQRECLEQESDFID